MQLRQHTITPLNPCLEHQQETQTADQTQSEQVLILSDIEHELTEMLSRQTEDEEWVRYKEKREGMTKEVVRSVCELQDVELRENLLMQFEQNYCDMERVDVRNWYRLVWLEVKFKEGSQEGKREKDSGASLLKKQKRSQRVRRRTSIVPQQQRELELETYSQQRAKLSRRKSKSKVELPNWITITAPLATSFFFYYTFFYSVFELISSVYENSTYGGQTTTQTYMVGETSFQIMKQTLTNLDFERNVRNMWKNGINIFVLLCAVVLKNVWFCHRKKKITEIQQNYNDN